MDCERLRDQLRRIDGRGYPAYKDLRGSYEGEGFSIHIDHVQGDPFAAPSKLRVRVPMHEAALPERLRDTAVRRMALGDALAREVRRAIGAGREARAEAGGREGNEREGDRGGSRGGRRGERGRGAGSGKSGLIQIDSGGQEVLERSAVRITAEWVEARVEIGLPAAGRRILGREAEQLLLHRLPDIVLTGLCWDELPRRDIETFVHCVENQEAIRDQLDELGLVAFVGNGAVLPRESGASERPLRSGVVSFRSPASFEVELDVPHPVDIDGEASTRLRGMGVAKGVTLIVGGGYHGKSTLLRGLERCVHPHIPGDGRELVVASRDLVKIRAEDGRRVEGVDIHPFISDLPGGRSTRFFCSDDASGSTSQAANIVEAVEAGCRGLLLDEDTSATNFMVRDARMQALVNKEFEPITPFLERVRELHDVVGISTVLVMGGCGDYFDVADRVIMLRDYVASDATQEARSVAAQHRGERRSEATEALTRPADRVPLAHSFDASRGRKEVKIDARGRDRIDYGANAIELRAVEQILDGSQTRAIGNAILLASRSLMDGATSLHGILDALEARIDQEGLEALDAFRPGSGRHPGNLARPRRYEIAAAINRLRTLRVAEHSA